MPSGDLLDPEGSEIYLKPITNYGAPGESVNFYPSAKPRPAARRPWAIEIVAKANKSDDGFGVWC